MSTHLEISPNEIQIPCLDCDGYEREEDRDTHGNVPPTFLHVIIRHPKSNDFHVKGGDDDR